MPTYRLDLNNSGGSFWIGRKEVDALYAAGWWVHKDIRRRAIIGSEDNYLGSGLTVDEVRDLRVEKPTMQEAIEEFEKITGQDFFALGCTCCGAPFHMYEMKTRNGDTYDYVNDSVMGGDYVRHEPQRPF